MSDLVAWHKVVGKLTDQEFHARALRRYRDWLDHIAAKEAQEAKAHPYPEIRKRLLMAHPEAVEVDVWTRPNAHQDGCSCDGCLYSGGVEWVVLVMRKGRDGNMERLVECMAMFLDDAVKAAEEALRGMGL